MESATQTRRKTGRPRSFDRDAALHAAMLTFWRHGYESTSVADLTAAMGITPPSLYGAFGDKKRLFRETVGLYLSAEPPEPAIAAASSAREAAQRLLTASAEGVTGDNTPTGCLLATSALSCSTAAADVQAEIAAIRHGIEAALRARIQTDIDDGTLPDDTDADALAGHMMAMTQGLSTLARDGASREKLLRVVAQAMKAWP
ncbi:TetR family transcriptional regulator [Brevundimonas sp. LM2]|uniref:TetR/AcrR family transcriptional regulator n=1 Tax=Brevundimonas sp. LM2 TaxID=1938605 RepID=UPI000983D92E|nr:TetR/AcrR family transcriptional regulator [Brevundimonas sp. LM2]AQR61143.1 TetR family transcriptional regulator [Brevundimonas sp. LM2]